MKHGNPALMREEAGRFWERFRDELDDTLPDSNLTRRIFNTLLEEGQGKMNDLIDLIPAESCEGIVESVDVDAYGGEIIVVEVPSHWVGRKVRVRPL